MGSRSRRKGNRAEQEACAALRRLGHDAVTSRDARAGTQGGADLVCPTLPVALEVKDQSRDALPGWLDQARQQATDPDRPGAVLHKRRGKARAEQWFLTMQFDDFVGLVRRLRSKPLDDQEVEF